MSGDELEDREGPALGSDPFRQNDGTLPYLLSLRARALQPAAAEPTVARAEPPPRVRVVPPDLGPPVPELPTFEDGDVGSSALDRLAGLVLSSDDEARIGRLGTRLAGRAYDDFGLSPRVARRALAFFSLLYRHWFRVESSGHAVIPEKTGALLVANHGGLLPFDAAMIVVDAMLRGDPPRLVRTVVDRWAGSIPFVNVFYARVGQVIGSRENVRELLANDELVLVFPEGMEGIKKRAAERYVLQSFHMGFVEESLRHRVPIVPVAVLGADDQAPILWDAKPLARWLGLPFFPITPTFPWLGLFGLLPYPVKYEIAYGEPLRFFEEFPPETADDAHAVRYLAERVRRTIQEMVDRRVLARRGRRR